MRNKTIMICTLVFLILISGNFVKASTNISSCQVLTQANTVYNLVSDITIPSTSFIDCIIITAPNITLDCNKHMISASRSYQTAIHSDQQYTTIKNCEITGNSIPGTEGIYLESANNSEIYNNIINSSSQAGLGLNKVFNSKIENLASNLNGYGINFIGSDNQFTNVTANSNTYNGIFFSGSNNQFTNIELDSNHEESLYIIGVGSSNNNKFTDFVATSVSVSTSLEIGGSSNNIFTNGITNIIGISSGVNNTFLNVTNTGNEYIQSGGGVYKKMVLRLECKR